MTELTIRPMESDHYSPGVQFRVLGPVKVIRDGIEPHLGGPKQRLVLAMLIRADGRPVTTDALVDGLWSEDPPSTSRKTLQVYIYRLRELGLAVRSEKNGYSLDTSDGVDAVLFEKLQREGRHQLETDPALASDTLSAALALWTGPAYADLADEPVLGPEIARLENLRLAALGDRIDADLEIGQPDALVGELEGLIQLNPLQERFRAQHMVALHRAGRQVEALRAFQDFRELLGEEMGVAPSEDLIALDQAIATNDPSLRADRADRSVKSYEIKELIGVGAFAEVYRGVQPSLDREVAVKAIKSELANRPEFIRGFEAEASTVSKLEHPHIVPLYDFWREPDTAYLIMRWLNGGSLEKSLDAGPWSIERTAKLVEQIGSALSSAHRHGVVHRDVKPANVLLDTEGNTYLSDFGIALEAASTVTDPRAALSEGSPAYASPEQLRREPVGPPADVHGLAITVFEALTGRLPFPEAESKAALLRHALNDPIAPISTLRPELPRSLDAVMARATAKNPADRYQTIQEFVVAFTESLVSTPDPPAAIREVAQRITTASVSIENPYKGLLAFDEDDADRFFGRDRLVDELVDRLDDRSPSGRMLAVIGASGSGKSSVVRAGLIPAVRSGRIRGSDSWFTTSMSPGTHPFEALETALLRVAVNPPASLLDQLQGDARGILRGLRRILVGDDETVLLVIDQFEELFTLCASEPIRQRFLEALTTAVTEPSSPLRLVITLRADFYDHPLRYPGFAQLIKHQGVTVTPLAADELEQAILDPAARAGLQFEPGLVAEIVADVSSQRGALPLMQYTLSELYERRIAGVMSQEAYREIGGLLGALGRRADDLYLEVGPGEQTAIRHLFARLVTLGEGSEDTRRRVRRSELGDSDSMAAVIARYGDARLLTFDRDAATREPTVEVAHEALIREWPRLRSWLDENRTRLRLHRHMTESAGAWEAGGRDDGDLYRGARLQAIEEWAVNEGEDLNELEREFLEASLAGRRAEQEAEQAYIDQQIRQNRRLRRLLVTVAVVAVVAVLAGALAFQQQRRADDEAAAATEAAFESETRRISADAAQLVQSDRRVALLLAAEAYRRSPGPETLGALQRVLVGSHELIGYLGGGKRYTSVTWLGSDRVAAAGAEGVDVYSTDGNLLSSVAIREIHDLAASPDGKKVAIATGEGIRLWSPDEPASVPLQYRTGVLTQVVAWSPDGSTAVAGGRGGDVYILDPGDLSLMERFPAHPEQELEDLQETLDLPEAASDVAQHSPATARRGVLAVGFDPTGALMATAGWGKTTVWNTVDWSLRSSGPLVRQTGEQRQIAAADAVGFVGDPDGMEVITTGRWSVHHYDVDTGQETEYVDISGRNPGGQAPDSLITPAAITPELVATSISGGDVEITRSGTTLDALSPHMAETFDLAVSPDETRVAVAGSDGVAVLSLNGDRLLGRAVQAASGSGVTHNVTADGRFVSISVGVAGETQQVWRLDNDTVLRVPILGPEPTFIHHNGTPSTMITWEADRGHRLLDPETGRQGDLFGPARSSVAAMSPDESLAAVADVEGNIHVHRVSDLSPIDSFDDLASGGAVVTRSLAIDAQNRYVAATNDLGTGIVWNLETREALELPAIAEIAFGPDGEFAATVGTDGSVIQRAIPGFQPFGQTILGSTSSEILTFGPFFTPDGRYMITTIDGNGRIWDLETGIQIGGVFPGEGSADASMDARWLMTRIDDRSIRWDLDLVSWPEVACRAAGRNLTSTEWEQFGPTDSPYVATCDQYPDLSDLEEDQQP